MAGEPTASLVESVETSNQLSDYLKKALTRASKGKESTYLYHYTKIKYLVEMLKSRYMRLGSCVDMNDDFETAILKHHGLLRRLYYACFTKVPESLAMYKLYGVNEDSVMLKISYAGLEKILSSNATSEVYGKYSPMHNYMILENNQATNRFIDGKLYCTAVGYVDPDTMTIHSGSKEDNSYRSPFMQKELAGKLKYRCWEYEDELRLCGELSKDLAEKECLAVKLPDEFDDFITVTLCPGFDMDKNREHLLELDIRSIKYSNSAYSLYSDFLKNNGIPTYTGEYSEEKESTKK